jgi:hypothetical protein
MSNLASVITSLNSKIEKIVFLHKSVAEENMRLNADKQELIRKNNEQKEKIEQLEEQIKVIKMAKSIRETGEEPMEVKLKINELIREIDRCLLLLNS